MLNWLSELIEWVSRWIPRLVIIRTTHRAVKFVRGKKLILVEPGLCVYWPLITDFHELAVARQTLNLPTQRLVTIDGKRIIASAVVVYNVKDPILAVGKSWDYEETIRDVSMCAVARTITASEYDDLVEDMSGMLGTQLTTACKQGLNKYGVTVQQCMLTDFCPANVIALSNSDSFMFQGGDEEND